MKRRGKNKIYIYIYIYWLRLFVCGDMINYEVQIVWLWRNWIPWWWKLEITCEKSYLGYDKNLSEWSRGSNPLFIYSDHWSTWLLMSHDSWRVISSSFEEGQNGHLSISISLKKCSKMSLFWNYLVKFIWNELKFHIYIYIYFKVWLPVTQFFKSQVSM